MNIASSSTVVKLVAGSLFPVPDSTLRWTKCDMLFLRALPNSEM